MPEGFSVKGETAAGGNIRLNESRSPAVFYTFSMSRKNRFHPGGWLWEPSKRIPFDIILPTGKMIPQGLTNPKSHPF